MADGADKDEARGGKMGGWIAWETEEKTVEGG